jgi:alanine racemase
MSDNRPTVLEVDLENIARNTRTLKKIVGEAELMAVVKADAYGHGFEEVSRVCLENGATWLGVATIDEAIDLRNKGFHEPILVFSGIFPENMDICERNDIDITIQDSAFFKNFLQSGIKLNNSLNAHLKIDTGMHRLGVLPDELFEVLEESKDVHEVNIRGIWTHFPEAGNKDRSFTEYQLDLFDDCIKRSEQILQKEISFKHSANSAAILYHKRSHYNMVRPGLGLYGYYDEPHLSRKAALLPSIRMITKIVSIRDIVPGESISYGRTYVAKKKMRIATIPIGYADGYNRLHSNRGNVLLRGKKTKIVGRVCMDQAMIDISDFNNIQHGEEVVLLGRQGKKTISMYEMTEVLNSIPNDILVNFGKRIDKVYV